MEENKDEVVKNDTNEVKNYTVKENQVIENNGENKEEPKEKDIEVNGQVVTPDLDASIGVDLSIHDGADASIQDYSVQKPDFVIKSKKDTVAEENEERSRKLQEKVDQANANYKPNSKFQNFLLIFMFIVLLLFVVFLPNIREIISDMRGSNKTEEEKIVNGYLECKIEKSTANLDLNYTYIFRFSENKLYYLSVETISKGEIGVDDDELDGIYNKCNNLKRQVKSLDGITVTCDNKGGKVFKSEVFDYKDINKDKITSAYSEAEGTYPEFEYDADMDEIERTMNMNAYTCYRKN